MLVTSVSFVLSIFNVNSFEVLMEEESLLIGHESRVEINIGEFEEEENNNESSYCFDAPLSFSSEDHFKNIYEKISDNEKDLNTIKYHIANLYSEKEELKKTNEIYRTSIEKLSNGVHEHNNRLNSLEYDCFEILRLMGLNFLGAVSNYVEECLS